LLGSLIDLIRVFTPPGKRIHEKRAVILYVPAFQAGCREFEPRLPLFSLQSPLLKELLRLFYDGRYNVDVYIL
jgi:hypothetical protein